MDKEGTGRLLAVHGDTSKTPIGRAHMDRLSKVDQDLTCRCEPRKMVRSEDGTILIDAVRSPPPSPSPPLLQPA